MRQCAKVYFQLKMEIQNGQELSHQREVDNLKAKLSQKDEVIADLLTEHIAFTKKTGVKN